MTSRQIGGAGELAKEGTNKISHAPRRLSSQRQTPKTQWFCSKGPALSDFLRKDCFVPIDIWCFRCRVSDRNEPPSEPPCFQSWRKVQLKVFAE